MHAMTDCAPASLCTSMSATTIQKALVVECPTAPHNHFRGLLGCLTWARTCILGPRHQEGRASQRVHIACRQPCVQGRILFKEACHLLTVGASSLSSVCASCK
jgi:hypothetical protein